jgi:transposase-like protein
MNASDPIKQCPNLLGGAGAVHIWHIDETYIKVRGQWRYIYRAIDSNGDTVEFWFSERRNLTAAKRFLRRALKRHGRPERIVIDGCQTNREAILSCDTADRLQVRSRCRLKPIRIRQSAYLNNRVEQDHRAIIETAWVILNSPGAWLGYLILSMTAGVSTAPKPDL